MSEKTVSRGLSFLTRIIIVIMWLCVFLSFLYIPLLLDVIGFREKKFCVVALTEFISPEAIARFEEESGVKVKLTHFENDDELFSKLKISKGEGYDVVVAAGYMVDVLRKEGLLLPIEKSSLTNFKDIDKRLIGHYFDPKNEYSAPLAWIMYGIGYNKKYFNGKIEKISWDLIFGKSDIRNTYKIGMLNEMREAFFLASKYYLGKTSLLSNKDIKEVKDALIAQKEWVESYASDQVDYMLFAETVPLAIVPSSYMRVVFREQQGDKFAFEIPQEGSLVTIENYVISKACKRSKIAHQFINFLLSEEGNLLNSNKYGTYPANLKAYEFLDKDLFAKLGFPPSDAVIEKSGILRNDIPLRRLEDLWIAVKAS